jgi:membrane-associated protein
MNILLGFVRLLLHIDVYLSAVIQRFDAWTTLILFAVIFCETGLVVTPYLPGDSLLFAAGSFAAKGDLSVGALFAALSAAAILGNIVNYAVGRWMGPKVLSRPDGRILKKEYLARAHAFFEKYGGKTIIITRFVPIVRTFAPFVAGVGAMTWGPFMAYNAAGGVLWVGVCLFAGYFFGNLRVVKENFTLVILAIIFISILPAVIEGIRHTRAKAREATS